MSRPTKPTRPSRLRRVARRVYAESGLQDPPVISGLLDVTHEQTWRNRR